MEWGRYIFNLLNENDLKIKSIQEDINFFEEVENRVINYLEKEKKIKQENDGKWYVL